ncbi:thiamine biosynthesis lipoprotein [Tenacibaculum mesophilum]|uniref:FAD:protein FMN transferase n=3 Tax=Flavobacteriaceae TaxID=49546 RepID=A0ABM7CBU8_9FLAO|nr:FAD:protein FMN transferase [Tenacibaculum mesophilum]QFS29212.1 FAD:protein FMN transferase [Tenacibaculum mesophilum]SHF50672.1 thiamine biosynthesis lipoprotein [Tenacibaculum mesophilum]
MEMKMPQVASKAYITQTRFLFHCHIKIKIPANYPETLLEDCFSLLETVDSTYNSYQKGSYFNQINTNAGYWVTVDNVTINLLKQTIKIAEITNGSYDISAMPLIRLWGFYKEKPTQPPTETAIVRCLKQVNYKNIQIHGNHVKIAPQQELITGSFIKAYAVDQLVAFLKNKGVTDAIINAGGSTIYGLSDNTHPQWYIKIPHPNLDNNFKRLSIQNTCFSLSSTQTQFLEINGKKYSHIINAQTGFPSQNLQVGLCSKSACLGDMISTALFGADISQFKTIVSQLQKVFDFEVYIIDHQMQLHSQYFKPFLSL